jgi:hypothetical protein
MAEQARRRSRACRTGSFLRRRRCERFLSRSRQIFLGVEKPALLTQAKERNSITMGIPATMRALKQTSPSGPQGLRLITDAPVLVLGEVLTWVTAGSTSATSRETRGIPAS